MRKKQKEHDDDQSLINLFNADKIGECITACKKALEVDSSNAIANNLLGSCLAKQKNFPEAIFHLNCAVKLDSSNPTFLFNLALAQFESEDIDSAISHYKKALKINYKLCPVHFNLAKAYKAAGDPLSAINSYQAAIKLDASYLKAYFDLGSLYELEGRTDDAIKIYKSLVQANENSAKGWGKLGLCYASSHFLNEALDSYQRQVDLEPNNAVAVHNLGVSLWKLGKINETVEHYKRALAISPNYADAYNHLGIAYMAINDTQNALRSFEKSLSINERNASAQFNYGNALKKIKKWGSAIKHYRKAIQIDSNNDGAYVNMAVVYNQIGLEEEALGFAKKALEINPLRKEGYTNLGNYFLSKGEVDKALGFYHRATEIDAHYAGSIWNESFIHLLKGDFLIGWELYKCRWEKEEFQSVKDRMSGQQWNGEPIKGKTVLLHHEQGIGDTFQFIRYAKLMAEMGARVYVDCPPVIAKVIESADGVSGVYSKVEQFPSHDFYCPLLNLPHIFKTTLESIPNDVPYLSVSWSKSPQAEFNKDKINIGIVWAGNPNHAKDALRSVDFKRFEGLFGVNEKVMFYSLQVGERAQDLQFSTEVGRYVEDLSDHLTDFSATASVIERLDLVITVDTSVAHLTGALGKPVWTLLQFSPDWRWMLDRNDSPWYSTMRLFRQPKNGDWASVFKEVKKELRGIQKN